MHNTVRAKCLLVLAVFLGFTLAFSAFSTAYAIPSFYNLPRLSEIKSSAIASLDDEHDDENDDDDEREGNDSENNRTRERSVECESDSINDNLDISEQAIEFSDCEIDGNVKIEDSKVSFTNSKIDGNIDSEDSGLTLVKTRIDGNVHVDGGSIKLLDTVIDGNLECDDVDEYSIQGGSISGNVKGCGSGDDVDKRNSNNGKDDDEENDKNKEKKKDQSKKLKIKVKKDGGRVDIEEDDDEDDDNNTNDGNNIRSFPTEFILEAEGGIALERGRSGESSNRFDDVSMLLSASGYRLERNLIRVSVEGQVLLDDYEFEITDGRGIIIFFKNPSKEFFRGIIHIAGVATNAEDDTEKRFHLRALLLPPLDEDKEGVWSFIVAPSAKIGRDIRVFQLLGQLSEFGNGGPLPTPNPSLDHFEVSTIGTVTAGKQFDVTVTAVNSEGKILTGYEGRAHVSDLTGTVEPETTPRFNDGVFRGKLRITEAMTSDKLTFTDTATNKKGTSNAFNVVADSLAKVELTPSAVTIKPGEKANFTARGFDKFGNEISGLNFAWSLSSSELGSISIIGKTANFTASSAVTDEEDVTITAKISGGTLKDSSKITINPKLQTLDRFEIENISSPKTAGALFQITVKAVNSTGSTIKTYDGPMTLTDTTGSLSMTVSSGFSDGIWTGNVNITKAASAVKITAKDAANTEKKGMSNAFNVVSGSLAKLDLTPSTVTIAPAQKANFTAKGSDKFGNEIPPSALTIAWSLSSSNFGSIATSGNVANFTASSTITVNTNVTLTAKVGSISDESKITIKPVTQVLDHFAIDDIASPQKAGTSFSLTITAADSADAIVTSYSGPINLNDTTETLTVVTDNGFSNGVWTGTVKVTKASPNVKIMAEDKATPSKKGNSNTFEVRAGDIDHFEFNEIAQQAAGIEFSIVAKAMDEFGNKITDYNGTVELSTNDGNSPAGNASELSPTPYPFNSDDEGQHTFQVKLYNAKNGVTISISGSGKTSTSNAFTVAPSSIFKVTVTPSSVSIPEGEQLDFKAKAVDAFGNTVTGATFGWTVTSSLGTLGSTSGNEVEFTAASVTENQTGLVTATSGLVSGSATVTVTAS
jgi:hypothetical protein